MHWMEQFDVHYVTLFNSIVAFYSGILHISNISQARIDNIECLFCVGEQVRVMVVPSNIKKKLSFRYSLAQPASWFLNQKNSKCLALPGGNNHFARRQKLCTWYFAEKIGFS